MKAQVVVKLEAGGDDNEDTEETCYKRNFEKKFYSPATNETWVRTFLEHAKRDPLTGEIGKTTIFTASRNHTGKLSKILNEEIAKIHP